MLGTLAQILSNLRGDRLLASAEIILEAVTNTVVSDVPPYRIERNKSIVYSSIPFRVYLKTYIF